MADQLVYEVTFDKIRDGQMLWIGRAGNCMIQIEHPSVSKLQGYIKLDIRSKKIVYADMKSKNGSKIDTGALTPETEYVLDSRHSLRFGDVIKLDFYSLPDFKNMLESLK